MVLPVVRAIASRWYGFYYYVPSFRETMDKVSSRLASVVRLHLGSRCHPGTGLAYRPQRVLHLYEYEASGACREVRETLSMLDLDYVCLPCPLEDPLAETLAREGRWRLDAREKGGNGLLPMLLDPDTLALVSGPDIVPYLWENYGPLCGELDVTVVQNYGPLCGELDVTVVQNYGPLCGELHVTVVQATGLVVATGLAATGLVVPGSKEAAARVPRILYAEVSLQGSPVQNFSRDPSFEETFAYGVTCHRALSTILVQIFSRDPSFEETFAYGVQKFSRDPSFEETFAYGVTGEPGDAIVGRVSVPLSEKDVVKEHDVVN
ncbi:hypothetical protein T484DRAFT_1833201 [Baffinella frigidus]|nr:hypothetical protein T484DRAFT_1833201 [Cryptophyta sp. CCMP2293]